MATEKKSLTGNLKSTKKPNVISTEPAAKPTKVTKKGGVVGVKG